MSEGAWGTVAAPNAGAAVQYDIRFMDKDGRLGHVRTIECDDDDHALEHTAMVKHPYALELWQGDRCVWRFDASPIR